MLHQEVLMLDIDVDHWRNLQELLIVSAKERPRIVVIHEDGRVLKCVHSRRAAVKDRPERVDDPQAVARRLFEANSDTVELVLVFEREGFDEYFAEVQDGWTPDEDLDQYVRRAYETLDRYSDQMVTYPGPAKTQLGLQWKFGGSYEQVQAAVDAFAPANGAAVFGVFDGGEEGDSDLWATLVLGFDQDRKIDVLTTVDPSQLGLEGSREDIAAEISDWVSSTVRECRLSIFFVDLEAVRSFMGSEDKKSALASLRRDGRVIFDRLPEGLEPALRS